MKKKQDEPLADRMPRPETPVEDPPAQLSEEPVLTVGVSNGASTEDLRHSQAQGDTIVREPEVVDALTLRRSGRVRKPNTRYSAEEFIQAKMISEPGVGATATLASGSR